MTENRNGSWSRRKADKAAARARPPHGRGCSRRRSLRPSAQRQIQGTLDPSSSPSAILRGLARARIEAQQPRASRIHLRTATHQLRPKMRPATSRIEGRPHRRGKFICSNRNPGRPPDLSRSMVSTRCCRNRGWPGKSCCSAVRNRRVGRSSGPRSE
jgi:hypothetical protein